MREPGGGTPPSRPKAPSPEGKTLRTPPCSPELPPCRRVLPSPSSRTAPPAETPSPPRASRRRSFPDPPPGAARLWPDRYPTLARKYPSRSPFPGRRDVSAVRPPRQSPRRLPVFLRPCPPPAANAADRSPRGPSPAREKLGRGEGAPPPSRVVRA